MIDVGENATPSFFDIDGDGDLDMLIGTGGMPGATGFKGGLWLLKNEGPPQRHPHLKWNLKIIWIYHLH
jgi:hypothetical protein